MSEEKNKKKKQLQILGDFFGFLAVVIALIIPFLWEDMQKVTIEKEKIIHVFYMEIMLLLFVGICAFYFLRYQGKEKAAEIVGIILFIGIPIVILILTAPFIEIIRINVCDYANMVDLWVTTLTVILTLSLYAIGVIFYIYTLKKVFNFLMKKETENTTEIE